MAAPLTGPTAKKDFQVCLAKLEEIWSLGGTDINACDFADISSDTLNKWLHEHSWLSERRKHLRERPLLLALRTVNRATKTNEELALKVVSKRLKSEWSDRTELTGADGEDLKIVITEEHAAKIAAAVKK